MNLKAHITEKSYATIKEDKGAVSQYTFRIPANSNKGLVKRSVEAVYKVHVTDVRIINLPGKVRVFKGKRGSTQARKKAIVRLMPGERIADFNVETEKKTAEETK